MSSRFGPASRCCVSARAAHAFPTLVRRRRVPCSSRVVPSPRYMCFCSLLFRHKAVSLSLLSGCHLWPFAYTSHVATACVRATSVAASLAPVFHHFLSLFSRRSPAPATCVPVSRHLRCFACVLRSVARRLLACAGCRAGLLCAVETCISSVQFFREGQALSHWGIV